MITITIETENAAFCRSAGGNEVAEVARILANLASWMQDRGELGQLDGRTLHDVSGNRVGVIRATTEDVVEVDDDMEDDFPGYGHRGTD